jgi:hypothetical protein
MFFDGGIMMLCDDSFVASNSFTIMVNLNAGGGINKFYPFSNELIGNRIIMLVL